MTPALLRIRPVLFLGERLWGATPARPFLAVLAIVLLLAALAWELPGRGAGGSRLSRAHLWRYERLPRGPPVRTGRRYWVGAGH